MKNLLAIFILFLATFLSGCTTAQKINRLDISAGRMNQVCIVEHKAIRETVLEVIKEGLTNHGVNYRVIAGNYEKKNNFWIPTFQDDQATGCDAMLFYVANWNWDITMYMHFASIWMTTPDRKKNLGLASYDARASLNKFINAREKLLELTDGLFEQYKNPTVQKQVGERNNTAAVTTTTVTTASPVLAPTVATEQTTSKTDDAATSITSKKLRELQALKKDGLITEDDYQIKKKQLLEKF